MTPVKNFSVIVLISSLATTFAWANESVKPNVVFMMMDNLGWGEIGVYGGGALRGRPGVFGPWSWCV